MHSFKSWLQKAEIKKSVNENEIAFPPFFKEMEKEGDCKALPLQYIIFFNDENIREAVQVRFSVGEEKFTVTQNGTYFKGKTVEFSKYRPMLNYVKLYMISLEFKNSLIADELYWIVNKYEDTPFEKLKDQFLERIQKSEMKLSPEEFSALGISKNDLAARRFGL